MEKNIEVWFAGIIAIENKIDNSSKISFDYFFQKLSTFFTHSPSCSSITPSYSYNPQCVGAYYQYFINRSVVPKEILYVSEPLVKNLYATVYILNWKDVNRYYYPYKNDYRKCFLEDQNFTIEDPVLEILNSIKSR